MSSYPNLKAHDGFVGKSGGQSQLDEFGIKRIFRFNFVLFDDVREAGIDWSRTLLLLALVRVDALQKEINQSVSININKNPSNALHYKVTNLCLSSFRGTLS